MTTAVHFIDSLESPRQVAACKPIVVLKFGSSVLTGPGDTPDIVSEIYRWVRAGRRVLAVVSAFAGATDRLLRESAAAGAAHDNVNAPAYVATGEEASAAWLALACDRAGLCATALKTPELGILAEGPMLDAMPIALNREALTRALAQHDVVVAPGFVASDRQGRIVLLGRGGSDLTAIFLGQKLGGERVRLIKDVDGVYEADPATVIGAKRFARVHWAHARDIAGQLIQPRAIDFAAACDLPIEVAALGAGDATIVSGDGNIPALPRVRRRLRVALAGLGIVGGGVALRLSRRPDLYEIVGVAVRDPDRHRDVAIDPGLFAAHPCALLDARPDIVVDALSDGPAGARLSGAALRAGVCVVSANKQAIASAFADLIDAADASGATLLYSAAVGGAAPVLEAVRAAREADIQSIEAVLSGAINFVLGQLGDGESFAAALAAARAAGLAEEDACMDLDGRDAAAKLQLIALEAFGEEARLADLHVESLNDRRAQLARRVRLKQVSRIVQRDGALRGEIVFEPALHGPFADLGGDRNALIVKASDGRVWTARGRGAGRWPTTESVLADIAEISTLSRLAPGAV